MMGIEGSIDGGCSDWQLEASSIHVSASTKRQEARAKTFLPGSLRDVGVRHSRDCPDRSFCGRHAKRHAMPLTWAVCDDAVAGGRRGAV